MLGNGNVKGTLEEVFSEVGQHTKLNGQVKLGEELYAVVEDKINTYILGKLSWWQRMTLSSDNKKLLITLGVYAVIYALKTGGFGLTSYRVKHDVLDLLTLVANKRIMDNLFEGVSGDIKALFEEAPVVENSNAQED